MMLQTIPTITTECMLAQDEIAKRLPPCVYANSFLENLEKENPAVLEWVMSLWNLIEEHTESNPHRDMMRAVMIAHMGIMYSTIKAQIEGEQLDRECRVCDAPETAGKPVGKEKNQQGKNDDGQRRGKHK